jgi:hypothetical protein
MANRPLAATALAAVPLILLAGFLLTRSSKEDRPVSQKEDRPVSQEVAPRTDHVAVPAAGRADARHAPLVIETPPDGTAVGMREDLTGRVESEGWPVIFVRSAVPGQPWWCQAPVTKVDGGRFTAQVVFGDENTASGTKFRIAGVVAPTREEAQKFAIGSKGQSLPEGLPRSDEVEVKLR